MAALILAWTKLALDDLHNACEYISIRNATALKSMCAKLESAIGTLQFHPEIGRPGRVAGTRELVVAGTPFVVPYRIKKGRVENLAIIHTSRKWPQKI